MADKLQEKNKHKWTTIHVVYMREVPTSYKGNNTFKGMVNDDMNTCQSFFGFFERLWSEAV
jgi:hypothetical protein